MHDHHLIFLAAFMPRCPISMQNFIIVRRPPWQTHWCPTHSSSACVQSGWMLSTAMKPWRTYKVGSLTFNPAQTHYVGTSDNAGVSTKPLPVSLSSVQPSGPATRRKRPICPKQKISRGLQRGWWGYKMCTLSKFPVWSGDFSGESLMGKRQMFTCLLCPSCCLVMTVFWLERSVILLCAPLFTLFYI